MTKKDETQAEQTPETKPTKPQSVEGVLPVSGIKVVMKRCNGHTLMKARQAANGGFGTTAYLIAETTTFDGKKMPAEEILELDYDDNITLEDMWGTLSTGKSRLQET